MTEQSNGCLSLDGDDVYFEVAGAPDAPVVVLGHGAGGNHAIWFQQVPVFAHQYRVVTWDQRGFGNSTNRNELASPATATRDLVAILDHLGVDRAHVVGQSMGGWAAMGLAVAHPERVHSLVLADTLAGIAIDGWWNAAAAIAPRVGPFNHPALANEFCIRFPDRAHLYLQIGGLRRDPLADQTPLMLTLAKSSFTDEQLAALAMPTLFIVGTHDEIFPPASVAAAAERVPGATVELVEGAGHSPYFEQPGIWNALVEGFWFPQL
jgi:pimeloyl-ACP methyl ester carboxylesterase